MVEDIVILNLKENILLQATDLTAKNSLLEYLELVSKNDAVKVVLFIGSPHKTGGEEYISFYRQVMELKLDRDAE